MEHIHLWRGFRVVGVMQRPAAAYLRQLSAAAVGLEVRVPERACLAGRATSNDTGRSGVAEERHALPLARIQGVRDNLAATDQNR